MVSSLDYLHLCILLENLSFFLWNLRSTMIDPAELLRKQSKSSSTSNHPTDLLRRTNAPSYLSPFPLPAHSPLKKARARKEGRASLSPQTSLISQLGGRGGAVVELLYPHPSLVPLPALLSFFSLSIPRFFPIFTAETFQQAKPARA